MFNNVHTFACLPRTTRGNSLVLGGDPKGKNFLYTNGNSVIIRDIANPNVCDIYTEHSTLTTVAKYSPSGFYIASADQHGKIRVWDTTQKEHILKNEIQPFVGIIKDLAWSADSQRIVAVGEGRERFGHVFATDTGTSIGEISGHSKIINSCDFKPNRPFKIITGSEDTCVGIYEGPPFKFKSQVQDHNKFVQAVRFSPSGDQFASAGFDGKLFIYNSNDYTKLAELGSPAHGGGIYAISWSPDGKQLLTASGDKTCKIWNVETSTCLTEFTFGTDILDQQVSCLWQEPFLLSISLSGFINYLDKNNPGKPLRILKGHNKSITSMAVAEGTDDVKLIFTGSHDGYVTRWSSKTGEQDRVEGQQHSNQVQDMTRSKDLIYTCGFDDTIRAIDIKTGRYSSSYNPLKLSVQPKGICTLNDSGSLIIAGFNELQIIEKHEKKTSLKLNYEANSIDVHPNRNEVAVAGISDNKVHIYAIENNQLTETKTLDHRGGVTSVKYSPNGTYLAAGDSNRKIKLYKVQEEYKLAHDNEWGFHTAKVNCLGWSANSTMLASGGLDTNLIVWFPNEPSKHYMIKQAHPQNQLTKVCFVGENLVASTGQDATVRIWSIQL